MKVAGIIGLRLNKVRAFALIFMDINPALARL